MQRRTKLGAFTFLNAVLGPQSLRAVTQFDLLEGLLAGMRGSERRVVRGMPVLRKYDVLKVRSNPVDRVDYRVSIGNGKRAAGAEIVLNIGDDENVMLINPHRVSLAEAFIGIFILSEMISAGAMRLE